MRFCLWLDKLKHIFHEECECLNWLPVTDRFKQCAYGFNEQGSTSVNNVSLSELSL